AAIDRPRSSSGRYAARRLVKRNSSLQVAANTLVDRSLQVPSERSTGMVVTCSTPAWKNVPLVASRAWFLRSQDKLMLWEKAVDVPSGTRTVLANRGLSRT